MLHWDIFHTRPSLFQHLRTSALLAGGQFNIRLNKQESLVCLQVCAEVHMQLRRETCVTVHVWPVQSPSSFYLLICVCGHKFSSVSSSVSHSYFRPPFLSVYWLVFMYMDLLFSIFKGPKSPLLEAGGIESGINHFIDYVYVGSQIFRSW